MKNETVKLTELANDVLVSFEDARYTLTAEELRKGIKNGDESPTLGWYVAVEQRWKPSAKYMVERYIEGEYDNMYEDWDERAFDCLKPEHYERIQAILDEAFSGDHATKYWTLETKIEVDVEEETVEECA